MSEKSGTRPTHEGEIAVIARGGCRLGQRPWESPTGACLIATVDTLLHVHCDAICVVENWEAMRSLHLYRWLRADDAKVLYVFRGDTKFSPGPVKSFLSGRTEPLWAFVDFDPAGLGIANGLPGERLARLVLPTWEWLASAADTVRGRELFGQQAAQWSATLDSARHPLVRAAWTVLSDLQAGVTQERMLGAPE
ncbi:DUF7281 domain-containing protein [Acidovorax sp. sic0104]|uniref:DUF7281 domain-containing protein n=1 Tax=Acidovorax sp. sic0104 TaxID=2854784 RepID=UPI00403F282E